MSRLAASVVGVNRRTPRTRRLGQTERMDAVTLDRLDAFAASVAILGHALGEPSANAEALRAGFLSLVAAAGPLLETISAHTPDCAAHLTLLADAAVLVDVLPPAALERAWVHDGSMPPASALCESAQQLLKVPARIASQLHFEGAARREDLRALLMPLEEALPRLRAALGEERAR